MKNQFTSRLMMVRPAAFGYNEQTALTNAFQHKSIEEVNVQQKALREFDVYVEKLNSRGLEVIVFEDTAIPPKPDALFPNNWISMHHDGTLCLYPMCTENRRIERSEAIIAGIKSNNNVSRCIDISSYESERCYLEGTGSIIFDHEHNLAYAGISERSNKTLFEYHCASLGYTPVSFSTMGDGGIPIYHTNVMLTIGSGFAVIGDAVIADEDKQKVVSLLNDTGHEIIHITSEQIRAFAGNMLQVGDEENHFLVMSQTAFMSLIPEQVKAIERHTEILPVTIDTIEQIGGGSARCMLAEIFLQKT